MSILEEIVNKRRERIAKFGYEEKVKLPEKRTLPLVPFCRDSSGYNDFSHDSDFTVICEFKRQSPSRG